MISDPDSREYASEYDDDMSDFSKIEMPVEAAFSSFLLKPLIEKHFLLVFLFCHSKRLPHGPLVKTRLKSSSASVFPVSVISALAISKVPKVMGGSST